MAALFVNSLQKRFSIMVLLILCMLMSPLSWAQSVSSNNIIRVAVIVPQNTRKPASSNYQMDYFRGIQVADYEARSRGLHVVAKLFQYASKPLAILNVVESVKKWHPDFIIGPADSGGFLLLKKQFKHVLVISALATASNIAHLPKNFYSFSLPDEYMARALASFVDKKLPHVQGLLTISTVDCVSCNDMAVLFARDFKATHPGATVITHNLLSSQVDSIPIEKLTAGYQANDVIFIPDLSSVAGVLVWRVTHYLHDPKLIFLGDDQWDGQDVGADGALNPYVAYHVPDWSFARNLPSIHQFDALFESLYGYRTKEVIAYEMYHTVHSVLSLINVEKIEHANKPHYILRRFLDATINHPNRFRQKYYVIYKIGPHGDQPTAFINVKNWHLWDG